MKQLLVKAIACAALLLPVTTAQAKEYGGWAPGKTFRFTVKAKVSGKADALGNVIKKAPVPAGVPNYSKGQKVKFTIGPKGQLQGPDGLNLPFKSDGGSANVYANTPSAKNPQANVGEVFKNASGKPVGVALTFFKVKLDGFATTTYVVHYTLE